jgi:hypothetical protein
MLTRNEFDERMSDWMRQVEAARNDDVAYLLSEIDAVEQRAGSGIHSNRKALEYAWLASRPGISEQ